MSTVEPLQEATQQIGTETIESQPIVLIPEGLEDSGVQIGSTSGTQQEDSENSEEEDGMYLGDRIKLQTTKYGLLRGTIYYYDVDALLRIMPDGVSNTLYSIPIIDGDPDPDIGITGIDSIGSGPRTGFVEWQGFHVDQELLSFLPDGSLGQTYTVVSVNLAEDRMMLRDSTGAELPLDCNFVGIPIDAPFTILSIKTQEESDTVPTKEEVEATQLAIAKAQTEGADAAESLGEELEYMDLNDLEDIVGTFYVTKTVEVQELSISERIYSELAQKSELLSDLISMIDYTSQHNPLLLKRIRAIVELYSSLKNSIIQRSRDGRPTSILPGSLSSLLDVMQHSNVPIVKPVLKTQRVLVGEIIEDIVSDEVQFVLQNLKEVITESDTFLKQQGGTPAVVGGSGIGIPRWTQTLNRYFTEFPLGDIYSLSTDGIPYTFSTDGEYFRWKEPGSNQLLGLRPIGKEKEQLKQFALEPLNFTGTVSYSLRRGHGPILKPIDTTTFEILTPGDKANLDGYVLFPYKATESGLVGAIRTGSLWNSIVRSKAEKRSVEQLITSLGGIKDEFDVQHIFYTPIEDTTFVSTTFSDFLALVLQSMIPLGPADMHTLQYDLGIQTMEFNTSQAAVIQARVKQVLASLRATIRTMREVALPSTGTMYPLFSTTLATVLETQFQNHPILEKLVKQVAIRTPGYSNVDIALMATLFMYAKDYTLTVLGNNVRQAELEKISMKQLYLQSLLQEQLELAVLKRSLGQPPSPNPCKHTKELTMIRRANTSDSDRTALLAKFVRLYKGTREENWITCSLCKEHLVCHHEILQIQQSLHPQEYDVLQKQIILDYAGGLFGANYICKNCGLPILELDFDKNLEFDDEGRPMMGRSELTDTEVETFEELKEAFQLESVEGSLEHLFQSELQKQIYSTALTIANSLEVSITVSGYKKLVERAYADLLQLPTEAAYVAQKSTKSVSYAKYSSRLKIAYTAALVLLEIQTHTPPYRIEYAIEGCPFGFGGFPLTVDTSNQEGLAYVACVISKIETTEGVWANGFQTVPIKDNKRAASIQDLMQRYLTKLVATNITVQTDLEKRRAYTAKTDKDIYHKEVLPKSFLPRMESAETEAETATQAPSIPEGSRGAFGEVLKSDAWIRAVHQLARTNTVVTKGSPYSEASCCFSELSVPGKMLREASLPPMPVQPTLEQTFKRNTILTIPIHVRPLQLFQATPALEGAYRVFLELCWKGPRVGLPHEIGYDFQCDWCDTKVPTKYRFPDVNSSGTPILNEQELRSEFDSQSIVVTDQSFQALLDASHKRTQFIQYTSPLPQTPNAVIESLERVEPISNWSSILQTTLEHIYAIKGTPSGADSISALSPLRDAVAIQETVLEQTERIGKAGLKLLTSLVDGPVYIALEVIQSYFLIPAQRLLTNYDSKQTLVVQKLYKLSEKHMEAVHTILHNHTDYTEQLHLYPDDDAAYELLTKAREKLETFVTTLSGLIKQAHELRITRIQTTMELPVSVFSTFLKEVVRAIVIGPIASLVNPDILPSNPSYEGTDASSSDTFVVTFIHAMLLKYKKEYLSYNPLVVKQKLEDSKEREKQRFIGELDKLKDQDERRVELMKKRLGLGKWSIGGTKLVYAYDPDQWDKNREEMESLRKIKLEQGFERTTPEEGYDMFDNHGDDDDE